MVEWNHIDLFADPRAGSFALPPSGGIFNVGSPELRGEGGRGSPADWFITKMTSPSQFEGTQLHSLKLPESWKWRKLKGGKRRGA